MDLLNKWMGLQLFMSVFCQSCGVSNPLKSTFCVECGSTLQKTKTTLEPTPKTTQVTPQAMPTQMDKPKPKKLYRSRSDRKIAGVCAGFADNLNLDVTLVRLIAIFLLLFTGGMVVMAYLVVWAVVPEEPYLESIDNQGVVYR